MHISFNLHGDAALPPQGAANQTLPNPVRYKLTLWGRVSRFRGTALFAVTMLPFVHNVAYSVYPYEPVMVISAPQVVMGNSAVSPEVKLTYTYHSSSNVILRVKPYLVCGPQAIASTPQVAVATARPPRLDSRKSVNTGMMALPQFTQSYSKGIGEATDTIKVRGRLEGCGLLLTYGWLPPNSMWEHRVTLPVIPLTTPATRPLPELPVSSIPIPNPKEVLDGTQP